MNYGIRNPRIGQFALEYDQRSRTASISPAGRNCILTNKLDKESPTRSNLAE